MHAIRGGLVGWGTNIGKGSRVVTSWQATRNVCDVGYGVDLGISSAEYSISTVRNWIARVKLEGIDSIVAHQRLTMTRVVGYSFGTSPNSSRRRESPNSNTSGNSCGKPFDGDIIAT